MSAGFFESLFGPSRETVWRQLAGETGMEFNDGGFWGGDSVVANARGWRIILDTYSTSKDDDSTTYTRLRAPFRNEAGVKFKIYRTGLFSGLGGLLGMQDIVIGDRSFDAAFVIKGNSPDIVRRLLSDILIREKILAQPSGTLEARSPTGWFTREFPDGLDVLCFEDVGIVRDVDRLRSMFVLVFAVLERMREISFAEIPG